jgi:hypothetical protein
MATSMNAFYFQQWACYNKIDGKSPPYNKRNFQVWNSDCWVQEECEQPKKWEHINTNMI